MLTVKLIVLFGLFQFSVQNDEGLEKVYMSCGSPCPLTCENYQDPPICLTVCSPGFFCPEGTVEHGELCIPSSECTTEAPPTPTEDTWCPPGKVYSDCGPLCPLDCDNPYEYQCNLDDDCLSGCYCAEGTVQQGHDCVDPEQCAKVTEAPPPTTNEDTWCPPGKVYSDCGPLCPLDCDNPYEHQCNLDDDCLSGCYCAEGTVQQGHDCVDPEQCAKVTELPPPTTNEDTWCPPGKVYSDCGPLCPLDCDNPYEYQCNLDDDCLSGCYCAEGTVQQGHDCVDPKQCGDFPCKEYFCPDNFVCELDQLTSQPTCKRSVYVPCTADVPLACDSDFLRCVVENTTRQATCLPSCFLDNGNCDYDQTCVVAEAQHGSTVHCLDFTELSTECPAGMVMNECGSLCQETCDDVLNRGIRICPLVCGPSACTCPLGLVTYRDRCVDPKECYSLELYPPQLNPLPSVRTNVGLFKMTSRDPSVSKSDFRETQEEFLISLDELLSDQTGVKVELHAVLENDGGLELYVLLSGGNVSPETLDFYADLLAADTLTIPVDDVVIIAVPQVKSTAHSTISDWILVVGVITGVVLILILLVVLLSICCCCSSKNRKMRKRKSSKPEIQYSSLVSEGMSEKA